MSATFNDFTGLPPGTRKHVMELELFIGDLDGKTICIPEADGESFVDDGTVDADDAVKAVNALVAENERLRAALKPFADILVPDGDKYRIVSDPLDIDTKAYVDAYKALNGEQSVKQEK